MTTWKLSIKPESTEGFDPFKLCKEKSLLGIGWSGAYKVKQAETLAEAKLLVEAEYKKWPYAIRYLLEEVNTGDHVWLHQNGSYYLCKVDEDILYGEHIDKDFLNYDLGHARKARWVEVDDKLVSGVIQRGTIAQRMIQRIYINEKEHDFHELLFNNLINNPKWMPSLDHELLKNSLPIMKPSDFFSITSPDDVEDIVAAYLQNSGWMLVKSTCFRSKPRFEFMMQNNDHKVCNVQVKSGNHPDPLPPINYAENASSGDTVYLFSTNPNPYPGDSIEGVKTISQTELFGWVQSNLWALTNPLKLRLSTFASAHR